MLFSHAMRWRRLGVAAIPLKPDSKLAAIRWKEYQTQLPTIANLAAWFSNGDHNLGVICGNGLVVVDFDCTEAYAKWMQRMGHTYNVCGGGSAAESYTVRTRRGYHVYLWTYEPVKTSLILDSIDIKANGGYVVGEGSTVNGYTYSALNPGAAIATVNSLHDVLGGLPAQQHTHNIRVPIANDSVMPQKRLYRGIAVDIKARLSVYDLVSRYTVLSRSGENCYIGICPGHNDRNPSFRVVNGRCSCFKTDCKLHDARAMDAIEFYSRLHGLSYRDTMLVLGQELGLIGV